MTSMLHTFPDATDFDLRRQLAELEMVTTSADGRQDPGRQLRRPAAQLTRDAAAPGAAPGTTVRAGGRVSTMQSLLVTVNRAAGTADDDAVEAALDVLRASADVTVAATAHEDELVKALADRGERRWS